MEEGKPVKKRSLSSYLSNVSSRREELEKIAKQKAEEEARRAQERAEQTKREQEEKERAEKEKIAREEEEKQRVEEEKKRKMEDIAKLKRDYELQVKKMEEERMKREQEEKLKKEEEERIKKKEELKKIEEEERTHKEQEDRNIKEDDDRKKREESYNRKSVEVQENTHQKPSPESQPSPKKEMSSEAAEIKPEIEVKKETSPRNGTAQENPPHLSHLDESTDSSQFSNEPLSRHMLKSMLKEKKPPSFQDRDKDDDENLSDAPTEPASPPRAKRGRLVRGDQIEKTLIRNDQLAAASDSELSDIEDIKSSVLSSSVFQDGGLSPVRKEPITHKNNIPSSPVRRNSDDGSNNTEKRKEKKSHIAVSKVPKQKKSIYRDSGGRTRLQIACDKGKYDVAKKLIEEEHYDVNDQDNAGNSPLHEAALNGYLSIVKLLVSHGANVNIQSYEMFKDTPLVDASANGHLDVVQYLLKHGADPTITNAKGLTAYESIEEDSDLDDNEIQVVEKIKTSLTEATRRWKSKHGIQESTHTSDASRPSSPVIKHIEEPATSFTDEFYWTDISSSGGKKKLFRASKEGYLPYVGSYLENGGRPDFHAFLEAVKYGHEDIASIFLAFGARINRQNKEGLTPLMIAVGKNHLGTVRLLLEAGANPYMKDNRGRNAFYYAKHNIFDSIDDEEIKLLNEAATKWNETHGSGTASANEQEDDSTKKKYRSKEGKRHRDDFSGDESDDQSYADREHKRHQSTSKRTSSISRHGSQQELSKLPQRSESPKVTSTQTFNTDENPSSDALKNHENKLKHKSVSHSDLTKNYHDSVDANHAKYEEAEQTQKRPKLQSHVSEPNLSKEEEVVNQETPEEREQRLKAEEEYIQKRLQQKKKKELELLQKMEIDQQKREQEREKQRIEEEKRQEELRKQKEIELEKLKEAQELERRKAIRALYPLGLKLISFANKDDYARYLPLYYYTNKTTGSKYVLDIQMTVILKDDTLNNREFADSHEVKPQEHRKLWNLLKFIYLYGGNYSSDKKPQYVVNLNGVDIETRLGFETLEFTKFANLPMHWINFDNIEIDTELRSMLVENMVEIDVSSSTPSLQTHTPSRPKVQLQERQVPLRFRQQYAAKITQRPLW